MKGRIGSPSNIPQRWSSLSRAQSLAMGAPIHREVSEGGEQAFELEPREDEWVEHFA
jgi:hypothetical protein